MHYSTGSSRPTVRSGIPKINVPMILIQSGKLPQILESIVVREFFYWPILSHIVHPNQLEERTTIVSTRDAMNELLITLIRLPIKKIQN